MNWQVCDSDRELWERDLSSFVPAQIFDAHLHLYANFHFRGRPPALCGEGPSVVGWEQFQHHISQMMPGRRVTGLAFGFPWPLVNFADANDFIARETDRPEAFGQMLVQPSMDRAFIHETVIRHQFVGLKPYHVFASQTPTFEAGISSFLPEHQMEVADELGLSITLHIVRPRALADLANQQVLRRYATRYPRARLILAHAARGFNPHHTMEGIAALRGLNNIWFDTSAVTDSGAFEAILREFGHKRLLYGSDFPVSHLRGRCVALGDSFLWLSHENTNVSAAYREVQFSLVGLESLRSLKVAALSLGLTDSQVEDVFYNNAAEMFGLR